VTPFTVLGGYLGAGKTTLLNRLLYANRGLRLAVIVNDFGDIGIDSDLVVDRDGDTISLANGCICCSLAEGLAVVLDGLHERADEIDHVIVEASGVSDPARIGDYARPFGFELRGVIVLADAEQVRSRARDKYVGTTVLRQLRGADLIVLTKIDLVAETQLQELRAWLAEILPDTPIVESMHGELPSALALGDMPPSSSGTDGAPFPPHDYDEWSGSSATALDRSVVTDFVARLPAGVLRAKGIVHLADDPGHRYVLQVVGRRSELTRDRPWRADEQPETRLVVLGPVGSLRDGSAFAESTSRLFG
jgi:G3E family GTPase